jgi:uncharacterized protein DUF6494
MAKSKTSVRSKSPLSNQQVVVLAVYLAGGGTSYADTEDVAVSANEIAPGRFTWRKFKHQINIDTVRKRLWDASKQDKGGYLVGSERDGWLLTEAGLKFCKKNIQTVTTKDPSHKDRLSVRERSWVGRERIRMLAEPAYQKLTAGKADQISANEAERFFRLDDYVVGKARKTKIQRSVAAFDPSFAKPSWTVMLSALFERRAGRNVQNAPARSRNRGRQMNEDVFNTTIRKFLKKVGVTSQREIEKAVRDAVAQEGSVSV